MNLFILMFGEFLLCLLIVCLKPEKYNHLNDNSRKLVKIENGRFYQTFHFK